MKVLLDENLPHDLRHFLPGHEVYTVAYQGWRGVENGALLAKAAEGEFDVVMTMDTGIQFQHNPASLPVSLVVLQARSNALEDLRPLVPALLRALAELKPRTIVRIGA